MKLYLREEKTAFLLDALRARTLDAAIIALPWQIRGIETLSIAADPFLLACPKGHRLGRSTTINPDSMTGENVLLLEEGHCMRGHALSVCALPGIERKDDLAATSLQTMVQMVSGGLGISLVPNLAVQSGLTTGIGVTTIPFSKDAPSREIAVAWRSGSSREAEARLIGDILKRVLEPLSAS